MTSAPTLLSPTSRYTASALLALALHDSQFHHDDASQLWTHESCGLLRPVFRFLEVDQRAWNGLEETAANSEAKHHVGAYLRIIFEDEENSTEQSEQELALAKAVDATEMSLVTSFPSQELSLEKHMKQEHEFGDKMFSQVKDESCDATLNPNQTFKIESPSASGAEKHELNYPEYLSVEPLVVGDTYSIYQRKVSLLYVLLSACVADIPEDKKKASRFRKGYDARHRVALRLLATWLDIRWSKVEAMEIMIACSAVAASKAEEQSQDNKPEMSNWSKWKRGGIIGAAALTGGALLAITGGLAAPAIAAGFGALAPTLGTIVPFVGAGGFAAMASAAGSVAGSVAVAASFGAAGAGLSGSKMARRTGGIKEFEFKPIGDNHNQGRLAVGILISGFVFEEEDFTRPWKGWEDNLERYILQWESKNLITVSTAIQDWLTSSLTLELMRQGAMMTVLSTLVYALAWPAALLSATNFIDSKWSIAIDRSDKAGKLLAEALLKGLQGNRPVTLIGFSLGARVIFKCLQKLAESGSNEGLVERVVLLGAPVSVQGERWELARKIVAGRFINVYSTNDWILGVTFRASLLSQGLAGIQPVDIPGVENVDVTNIVDGHSSYLWSVQQILEKLELDTFHSVFAHLPVNI